MSDKHRFDHDIEILGNVTLTGTVDTRDVATDGSNQDTHIADNSLHRTINDAGTGATDLWSANKISTELGGKSATGHTHVAADVTDFDTAADARITAQKGNANGLASLDGGGKVPASQLSLSNVDYQGSWNASTNSPTITASSGTQGHYYVVGTAGSTNIDGITDWNVGDWIIFNGTVWEKNDNTDQVTSVAGKQGAVTLEASDITSGTFADPRIAASNVTQHEASITIGNISGAPTGAVVGISDAQTLTTKTIDADLNTITNIDNADIKAAAAIDATKIADGTVTSTEFQYINTLTSNAQTQLDAKSDSSHSHGWTDDGGIVRLTTATDFVGIGNSSPAGFFEARKVAAGTANHIRLTVYDTTNTDEYNLNIDTVDKSGVIVTAEDGSKRQAFVMAADANTLDKTIFGVASSSDSGSTWDPCMTVTQGCKVGIGKHTPSEALDISGNIVLSGTVDGRDIAADGTAQDTHIADGSLHRTINDAGSAATDLWSAEKISTELTGKASSSHTHAAGDVTSGTFADARIASSNVTQHEAALTIVNANISAGVDATKIADGTVTNAEFQYINTVTSNVQTQLDGKASSSHTHVAADVTDFDTEVSNNTDVAANVTHAADATLHRIINDSGTSATELWSANKIDSTLGGKAPQMYDAIVAPSGGDYTLPSAAFNAGHKTVFLRDGNYAETSNVIIPDGGSLVGESLDQAIITFTGATGVISDGNAGVVETAGTVSLTTGSKTVTGSGTTFTNLAGSNIFLIVNHNAYPIASVTNNTSLELGPPFKGQSISGSTYLAQQMNSSVYLSNITIVGSSSAGLYLRGLRHSVFENIICRNCTVGTEILHSANTHFSSLMMQNTAGIGFSLSDTYSCNLTDCQAFNSTGNGYNIAGNSSNIIIDSCQGSNGGGNGLNVTGTSMNIAVSASIFNNNTGLGINIDPSSSDATISSCILRKNGSHGIDFDGANNAISFCVIEMNGGFGIQAGNNGVLSSNHISSNGNHGINMNGDNQCTIVGNIIETNTGDGIWMDSDNNVISGNHIRDNTIHGIHITNTSRYHTITGNNIHNNATDGIRIDTTSTHNKISCNTISSNTIGVNVLTGCNDTTITNNTCRANSSHGISVAANTCIVNGNRADSNTGDGCLIVAGATDTTVIGNNLQNNTGTDFNDQGTLTSLEPILINAVDTRSATTLLLGQATATKVELADTGIVTEVQGNLDVLEGLDVTGNVTVTGTVDGRDVAADGTAQDSHIAATAAHGVAEIVGTTDTQTLTNKTISSGTNTVGANEIRTTGASVVVDTAAPPTTGQILKATSATTATWQSLAAGGDVTAASNLGATKIVIGDDGVKGVKESNWIINNTDVMSVSAGVTGFILDIHNTKPSGGNGFLICAGEVAGDLSFAVKDRDGTFNIMEMEANNGHIVTHKTYAETLAANGTVYGFDNQHSGVAKDFNTQHGTYRIGGTGIAEVVQTLTNKTITATSNNVTAKGLHSATTTVSVSAATAPTAGQALIATNSTTATWQNPLPYCNFVHANSLTTTTSTSHNVAPSMTITPPSGTYAVTWAASISSSTISGTVFIQIYAGGSAKGSEMQFLRGDSSTDNDGGLTAVAKVTVNGSEAIEGRWRAGTGTAEIRGRNLMIIQVSP